MLIPHPLRNLLTRLDTRYIRSRGHIAQLLICSFAIHCLRIPSPHDKDITTFEFESLVLGHGFHLLDCDPLAFERGIVYTFILCIRSIVEENTSSNDTSTLMEVIKRWQWILLRGFYRQTFFGYLGSVVGVAACLMLVMTQAIPLRGTLKSISKD